MQSVQFSFWKPRDFKILDYEWLLKLYRWYQFMEINILIFIDDNWNYTIEIKREKVSFYLINSMQVAFLKSFEVTSFLDYYVDEEKREIYINELFDTIMKGIKMHYKISRIMLVSISFFIGIGAFVGGICMLSDLMENLFFLIIFYLIFKCFLLLISYFKTTSSLE